MAIQAAKKVVGAPGFEPGASCAQGRRATRLRYAPTSWHINSTAYRRFHASACNSSIPTPLATKFTRYPEYSLAVWNLPTLVYSD